MEQKLAPLQALAKFWGSLNDAQRFVTAAFISLSIVLLVVVSVVATRPGMEVLFSGLQPSDSGAIVAKLQENKIPYEVEGTTIKVPRKHVHEMRMQLASQGLPQGGSVGFEIFDKNNLGMTEFSQRVSYQRALQGELSRTINQLGGVEQSRVHVAVPEPSVFADREKQATASVVLKLRPGTRLDSDQVGGIVHLVSSAVEGLKPNYVTVVDTNGNVLSEPSDEATGLDPRLSASQLKLKREHERQIEKNIQSMLERALGPNKAIVRVNARMNFDRTETDKETYVPVGAAGGATTGVLLSEQRLTESYGAGSGTEGGRAGVPSNLPPRSGRSMPTATGGSYQRTETTSKYEVSKTSEHIVRAPGQIERLSVAVMVDGKVDGAKIPAIRNAVSTAAGIDPDRDDRITIESIKFDDSAVKAEEEEMSSLAARSTYLAVAKTLGAIALLAAFVFFLKGMLKQVSISIPPVTVQEVPPGQIAAGGYRPPAAGGDGTLASMEQVEPEEVARVLRKWMTES